MPNVIDYSRSSGIDPDIFYGFPLFPDTDCIEILDGTTVGGVTHDYLSDGKAIVGFIDNASGDFDAFVQDGFLNKTPNTKGTTVQIAAALASEHRGHIRIVAQSATKAWAFYGTSVGGSFEVRELTISGTSITVGSSTQIENLSSGYYVSALAAGLSATNQMSVAWYTTNGVADAPLCNFTTVYDLNATPVVATAASSTSATQVSQYYTGITFVGTDLALIGMGKEFGNSSAFSFSGISTNTPAFESEKVLTAAEKMLCLNDTTSDSAALMVFDGNTDSHKFGSLTNLTGVLAASADTDQFFGNSPSLLGVDLASGSAAALTGNFALTGIRTANESASTICTGHIDPKQTDFSAAARTEVSDSITRASISKLNLSGTKALLIFGNSEDFNNLYATRYR